MIICVAGSGFISERAAKDLILDFLRPVGFVTFCFPYQVKDPEGMENAFRSVMLMADIGLCNYIIYHNFEVEFLSSKASKVLMVLDPATEPAIVTDCLKRDIPVYNLSGGLFPVTVGAGTDQG